MILQYAEEDSVDIFFACIMNDTSSQAKEVVCKKIKEVCDPLLSPLFTALNEIDRRLCVDSKYYSYVAPLSFLSLS